MVNHHLFLSLHHVLLMFPTEEHTKKASRPILHAFFGELMVGGFLSLLSFILVFSEALTGLSMKVFGEEESMKLSEMMETVHVVLFLIFSVFMLQILVLLFFAYRQGKKWHRAEKALLKRGGPQNHVQNAMELAEFETLRTQFVFPITPRLDDIQLPPDFLFSHYLSLLLGKSIAEMVHIPLSVWISVVAVFFVMWAVVGASTEVALSLFVVLVWSLFGVWAAVYWKLRRIYSLLVPPIVASNSINSPSVVELEEEKLLMPSRLDPPYLHTREVSCCGRKGNRHEALFWFGSKGPELKLRLLSGLLFLNSVIMALFGVWFAANAWQAYSPVLAIVLYALCVGPSLALGLFLIPISIRLLVVTSKIELLKQRKAIKSTLLGE